MQAAASRSPSTPPMLHAPLLSTCGSTACASPSSALPWLCADYELEAGATRNYEPWRDKEKAVQEAVAQREEEERGNAMKVRGGPCRLPAGGSWLIWGGHTVRTQSA